jgi:hypothetical protein
MFLYVLPFISLFSSIMYLAEGFGRRRVATGQEFDHFYAADLTGASAVQVGDG